jgi:hypothetical protein
MEDTDSNEWEMMVVAAQVATNTSQVAGSFLIFEEDRGTDDEEDQCDVLKRTHGHKRNK